MTLPTDTAYKAVDFVPTYTGRNFYPLNPRVEDVTIIDIAHHLSNTCRYGGAVDTLYSVAQHSCILTDYVEKNVPKVTPGECLQMLMHDASEYVLGDIPRPIKKNMHEYRRWEYNVTMCIRSWLGMNRVPIPPWQDEFDSRIIHDERSQLLAGNADADWQQAGEPLNVAIESPWAPRYAEQQFLMRYSRFAFQHFGSQQYLRAGWGVPTHSKYQPEFRTRGGDMVQTGPVEPHVVTDLIEVDVRGGCGRIVLRSENGMMMRDTSAGTYPRPAWEFVHGKFELLNQGVDHGLG